VVREARSWISTPYVHCADIKGVGVDCAMLLVRVFNNVGLIGHHEPRPYPVTWHLHQSEERFVDQILQLGSAEVLEPGPGDIVVWRIGKTYSHGGIITAWPFVVHAYAQARVVQEDDISTASPLSAVHHPRRFFSFWAAP
jgi:cell wall-associated NlpC family hydrolase